MQNEPLFADLKFGRGDGQLHYYCYNWRVAQMAPQDVGLVLL
jgi:glycylpeptide N-tetradecanoyltransferase